MYFVIASDSEACLQQAGNLLFFNEIIAINITHPVKTGDCRAPLRFARKDGQTVKFPFNRRRQSRYLNDGVKRKFLLAITYLYYS